MRIFEINFDTERFITNNPLKTKQLPKKSSFAAKEDDTINLQLINYIFTSPEEVDEILDEVDICIIKSVAGCKYLTVDQIYEIVLINGFNIPRSVVRKHIEELKSRRFLHGSEIVRSYEDKGLKYLELDVPGYEVALKYDVPFDEANAFIPYKERFVHDTPVVVKERLMSVQLVLSYLLSVKSVNRFSLREKFDNFSPDVSIRFDDLSIHCYQVVRSSPDSYYRLLKQVSAYYKVAQDKPMQLILCTESINHSIAIRNFLKAYRLWKPDQTEILFTEDLLNMKDSSESIYSLDSDNNQTWFKMD